MQRVVLLFAAILSVVRASPLGLDQDDRPTPSRYTVREEKMEFGGDALSDAFSEDSSGLGFADIISDPDNEDISFDDLFGDLELCGDLENGEWNIPEEGCVYVAYGNVHFLNVLSHVNAEYVYNALLDEGMEECDDDVVDIYDVPVGGCFYIDDDSVHLVGIYDDGDDYIENINDLAERYELEICDLTAELPEEGCLLFVDDTIGLMNVLNDDNIDDVERNIKAFDIPRCAFEDDELITTDICYMLNRTSNSIIFTNLDKDDPFAIFNREPSHVRKSKTAVTKKIKSRQAKGARGNVRRRGQQRGGKVNHLPKWMRHL